MPALATLRRPHAASQRPPLHVTGIVDDLAEAGDGTLAGTLVFDGGRHIGIVGADGLAVMHAPTVRLTLLPEESGEAASLRHDAAGLAMTAVIPAEKLARLAGALRDLPAASLVLAFDVAGATADGDAHELCIAEGGSAAVLRFDCWLEMQRRQGKEAEPAPGACC